MVIGLDGAPLDLIQTWVSSGRLPTLRKLLEGGTRGILQSIIPPITPTAWTSIVTGVNPGKHGIYNFHDIQKYEIANVNRTYRGAKALWNILSNHGKKSIIVNVPLTFPPERINGIMITDAPNTNSHITSPASVMSELVAKRIDLSYLVEPTPNIRQIKKYVHERKEILFSLISKFQWDFLMVVFTETDKVQHAYWSDKEKVLECYSEVDIVIKELINKTPENTTIFVISDHGYGSYSKIFHINNWYWKSLSW